MNLLIPYIQIYNHHDPFLEEFTYGDIGSRGKKLKRRLNKGDYVFLHTTIKGKKYITAYYVVDRVLDVAVATKDKNIMAKYRNPHLLEFNPHAFDNKIDDVVVFGDSILSKILDTPFPFSKALAQKLSLNIKFPEGKTQTQVIGSATRQWRVLTNKDIKVLLREIKRAGKKPFAVERVFATEEVTNILERDIEKYIEKNLWLLGKSLKLIRRQFDTSAGRIDLLFEDKEGNHIIVELKLAKIGREAINQLRGYMNWLKKKTNKKARGIIVCSGIMPAFEDEFKNLRDISIFFYGWKLKVFSWTDR